MNALSDRERDFFDKLHALCVEYDANMHGDAEQNYPFFNFSIGCRYFHNVTINDLGRSTVEIDEYPHNQIVIAERED